MTAESLLGRWQLEEWEVKELEGDNPRYNYDPKSGDYETPDGIKVLKSGSNADVGPLVVLPLELRVGWNGIYDLEVRTAFELLRELCPAELSGCGFYAEVGKNRFGTKVVFGFRAQKSIPI